VFPVRLAGDPTRPIDGPGTDRWAWHNGQRNRFATTACPDDATPHASHVRELSPHTAIGKTLGACPSVHKSLKTENWRLAS
jgi:hypothetical protein